MEQMTGSPWPSHCQANRNQGPRDTGIYGRLGADHLGRKTCNSYNPSFRSIVIRFTLIKVYIQIWCIRDQPCSIGKVRGLYESNG